MPCQINSLPLVDLEWGGVDCRFYIFKVKLLSLFFGIWILELEICFGFWNLMVWNLFWNLGLGACNFYRLTRSARWSGVWGAKTKKFPSHLRYSGIPVFVYLPALCYSPYGSWSGKGGTKAKTSIPSGFVVFYFTYRDESKLSPLCKIKNPTLSCEVLAL